MEKYIFKGGITRYWWIPLITGIVSIGLGVWCLFDPSESLTVLSYVFAGLMCAAGLLNSIYGIINSSVFPNWGWSLALGLLEIICGIWLFMLPKEVLVTTFIFTIAIWLIVVTINAICETCVMASYNNQWLGWLLALLLATLVFAVIFLAGPIAGGIAVWLYIGISLITFGVYRIILAGRIKTINKAVSF